MLLFAGSSVPPVFASARLLLQLDQVDSAGEVDLEADPPRLILLVCGYISCTQLTLKIPQVRLHLPQANLSTCSCDCLCLPLSCAIAFGPTCGAFLFARHQLPRVQQLLLLLLLQLCYLAFLLFHPHPYDFGLRCFISTKDMFLGGCFFCFCQWLFWASASQKGSLFSNLGCCERVLHFMDREVFSKGR